MAMPVSTEMGVTAPTTTPTITAQMTRPEMGTFVQPFTAGILVTPRFPNIKISQTNNQSNHDLNGMLHISKILNGIIN